MSPESSSPPFDLNNAKSCSSCCYSFEEDDTVASTYWDLDCGHRLCAKCFTSFSLSTTTVTRCCPSCKQSPISLVHTSFKFRGRGKNKRLHKVDKEISLLHPDEEDDFLTLHTRNCLPITVRLEPPPFENPIDVEEKLKIIFRKLKQTLVPPPSPQHSDGLVSHDRESFQGRNFYQKLDWLVENDSSSLLLECLSSLALGNDCVFSFLNKDRKNKFLTQMFVAAENIRHALDTRGSKFRQLMTDTFSILAQTERSHLLSKLGICYSRTTRDKYWKKGLTIFWSIKESGECE